MSATLNDFRQISASSSAIFIGGPTSYVNCTFQFSLSLIPLYKRAWKIFNINACGGYKISEGDNLVGNIATPSTKNGQFHFGFLTDINVLSSLFGPGLNYGGGNVALLNQNSPSIFPVLSASDLLTADSLLEKNDLQKSNNQSIFYSGVFTLQNQRNVYNNLLNARTLFSIPMGNFALSGSPFLFSVQADPIPVPSNYIIPPGFDVLAIFPFAGLTAYDPAAIGVPNFGYYGTGEGFNLSSSMNFNMLPLSNEDFERIIPV